MPRTVYPADSASQMSTNRGSALGRQQGQSGNRNANGVSGSMLGRASVAGDGRLPVQTPSSSRQAVLGSALGRQSNITRRPEDARHMGQGLPPRTHLGRQSSLGRQSGQQQQYASGQGMSRMAPIREENAAGSSLSARNMDQLNRNFGEMNVNRDINIDINNNHQEVSQSLVRRPPSNMQVAQQAEFAQQPVSGDYSIQQKRFIILSPTSVPRRLLGELCKVFQVRASKVKGWLEEGLIRTDLQKWKNETFPYDLELLTPQLTAKDIEKWDNFVRGYDDDRELRKAIGTGGWAYPKFERDFDRPRGPKFGFIPGCRDPGYWYDPRCPVCFLQNWYCGHVPTTGGSWRR